MYIKWLFSLLLTATLSLSITPSSYACSCMSPDLVRSYNNSDSVFIGRVLFETVVNTDRYWLVRVRKNLKGCTEQGDLVVVQSSSFGSACGASLQMGALHVFTSYEDTPIGPFPVFHISMCGYNVPALSLNAEERSFLLSRNACCDATQTCECVDGLPPVSCLADPCTMAQTCTEGTCEANYCGGCNAEFYNSLGEAVCQPW
jgi:hypothetical protein